MGDDQQAAAAGSPVLPTLALFVSMISFTAGASFAKRLFPAVGPEGATALRLIGGALILVALVRPWRTLSRTRDLAPVILYGIAMGAMNLLFYMALSRIPLGIAIALEFTGPLLVTVVFTMSIVDLIWVGLAGAGIALLLPISGKIHNLDPRGVAMALGAGVCWGIYILTGKRAGASHGTAAIALGMSVAAIAIAPVGIIHSGLALLRSDVLLMGLVVALLSSALPYSLEMYALRHLPVQTYGTLTSCEPAIGALAGLILMHETLSIGQIIAIGLVIVAAIGATVTAARARSGPIPVVSAPL